MDNQIDNQMVTIRISLMYYQTDNCMDNWKINQMKNLTDDWMDNGMNNLMDNRINNKHKSFISLSVIKSSYAYVVVLSICKRKEYRV